MRPGGGNAAAAAGLSFGDVCAIENLRLAFDFLKANARELKIDPHALEAFEGEGIESFLQKLNGDLHSGVYQPGQTRPDVVRDQIVEAALRRVLEDAFPRSLPCPAEPGKAVQWVAAAIEKGLTRVYAVSVEPEWVASQGGHLAERLRRRGADAKLAALIEQIGAGPSAAESKILDPILADIAYSDIDKLLEQTRAFGHEGAVRYVQCLRNGNEIAVLVDPGPRFDWILTAAQKRLHEELAGPDHEVAAAAIQRVELERGERMVLLGHELRWLPAAAGGHRVEVKRLPKSGTGEVVEAAPERDSGFKTARGFGRFFGWLSPLRFLQRSRAKEIELEAAATDGDAAAPAPSASLPRWTKPRLLNLPSLGGALRVLKSIEVTWKEIPGMLAVVFLFMFGWDSVLTGLCLVTWVVLRGREIGFLLLALLRSSPLARLGWTGWLAAVSGIAALVCLGFITSDLYSEYPHESRMSDQPPGFFLGSYPLPKSDTPTWYGLYVPPHFRRADEPLPMIVFFHGRGERTKETFLGAGLAESIRRKIKKGEPFDFVAMFPQAPSGTWKPEETGIAKEMIDYVVQRHRIDPKRIYLTGHSAGGNGLWGMARNCPDKWAAIVALCCGLPGMQTVGKTPCWVCQGDSDHYVLVESVRNQVKRYRDAGLNLRYTEFKGGDHKIWPQTYSNPELFDWLARQSRP